MSRFNIHRPTSSGGGDQWDKGAHVDHLHLFVAADGFTADDVDTSYGVSPAVKVDAVVCCDCVQLWDDQLIFGAALVPRLDGNEPGVVVGRLGQGLAKPGRSAPWVLDDPTDDDLAAAEAFLEQYATVLPSGAIVVDARALRAVPAATNPSDDEPY